MDKSLPTTHKLLFPAYYRKSNVEAVVNFMPEKGDVLVSMYPTTASTWLLYCLWKIFYFWSDYHDYNLFLKTFNCLECTGIHHLSHGEPRILWCHLNHTLIKRNSLAKYIYVTRNPKDILVSYYFDTKNANAVDVSFDSFFDQFIQGLLPYGNYFEHVRSWYKNRSDNILFLNYERMHVNPRRSILEIAKFLGPEYFEACLDESLMNRILNFPNFDHRIITVPGNELLSCMPELVRKHYQLKKQFDEFIRQRAVPIPAVGYIGVWRNYLTEKQNIIMNIQIRMEFTKEMYRNVGEIDVVSMLDM